MNKKQSLTIRTLSVSLLGVFASVAVISTATAQSTLQGATSGVQPQTQQTQQTANTQNQSGTLQDNSGEVLNQSVPRPLGVVSSPNQITPDAVVAPSSTLKTEVGTESSTNNRFIFIAIGSLVIVAIGIYVLQRSPESKVVEAPQPKIKPEPLKVPKKKRQNQKKKKSKR